MQKMTKLLKITTYATITSIMIGIISIGSVFLYFSPNLPKVEKISEIKLQIPLRIYTRDAQLIAEFGSKRRDPIKFNDIPALMIKAFLAAEDDNFYHHHGFSIKGLTRAILQQIMRSKTKSGGSTITQQVAKNYFLSSEKKITRKIRELILALQLEQEFSKDEILELYVNKIFLGNRAYGISAAAQVYYGTPIQALTLAQMAMIAGLPKAPSVHNPLRNPTRALQRRNWILGRMLKLNYINLAQYDIAINELITANRHDVKIDIDAPYAAEMARKYALDTYGPNAGTQGYRIITSIDGRLQKAARKALYNGLIAYDKRHGLREKEAFIASIDEKSKDRLFKSIRTYRGIAPAIVMQVSKNSIRAELRDGSVIELLFSENLSSTRAYINENTRGPTPKSLNDVAKRGDIIRVRRVEIVHPNTQTITTTYELSQIPRAEAALVSLNPEDGSILALVGGFDFYKSKFNRSTQAARQVGSNIKPFVYAAALDNGFTPATIINDAPVIFNDAKLENTWRPNSADKSFLGPTRLRKALYLSRNLVSIRILRQTGITRTRNFLNKFGLSKSRLTKDLSLALGSSAFSPLDIAQAYATFANGGFAISPHLIKEVYDGNNQKIYQAKPNIACDDNCGQLLSITITQNGSDVNEAESLASMPASIHPTSEKINKAPRIISPQVAFLMDDILKDVIRRGTGNKARQALRRDDIAGKTGTTNGPTDAWFSGYSPHIVTTTWLGFDDNSNIGRREFGSSAALPIWIEYMQAALKGKPEIIS